MQLETARLILRPLLLDDDRAVHRFESDPEVVRYMPHDVHSLAASRAYIEGILADEKKDPRQVWEFAICRRAEGELIGRCGFRVGQTEAREASLWYSLRRDLWGQGYAPEAMRAIVRFAFRDLKMHRLVIDCDPRNLASARVAEKLGMRREAHFLENICIKGEWCDSLIYAMLEREYRETTDLP